MDTYGESGYELKRGSESIRPGDGSDYRGYLAAIKENEHSRKTLGQPSDLENKSQEKEGPLKQN